MERCDSGTRRERNLRLLFALIAANNETGFDADERAELLGIELENLVLTHDLTETFDLCPTCFRQQKDHEKGAGR